MGDNTTIPKLFNNFVRLICIIGEMLNEQKNNTMNNKFNANCIEDFDCEDMSLFCNLTTKLCRCTKFYSLNENSGICEFQQANMTLWLQQLQLNKTIHNSQSAEYITVAEPDTNYQNFPHWAISTTMAIGVLFLILCTIYACFGDKIEGKEFEVSYKEKGARTVTT